MDYKPNTALIIDDFHLTKSMRVTALFRRFVMEMPDDFHIVILTRDAAGTVQTHLHNIYLKLEVSGRTAAVKKAQKLKLI